MKTLLKIAALATAITALTACSWFSNDTPHTTENPTPQIDTTIKASKIDSSKMDTMVTETGKDTSNQASK